MRILPRTALCFIATGVALAAGVTLVPRFGLPWDGAPDLVLLVVLALGAAWGTADGAIAGFGAGLLQDLAPPGVAAIGSHALTYTLVGALAGYAAREMRRSALRTSLISAAYAAGATVFDLGLGALLGNGAPWSRPGLADSIGATALYTAIAAPLVLPGLYALARRLHAPDARTLAPVGAATRQSPGLTPVPPPSFADRLRPRPRDLAAPAAPAAAAGARGAETESA